ncbi:MAG: disulfide bond formation protein B [Casimicrobiaceae bacterium]|nr:disulfide bond formation protein B [Casimicrobiaceae bacterium]MCX8098191.1 disulfide bond formation protein B [Casimicrobiaceae bacterium]MDW8313150.1 disulfide bond formation protein B [Burkholderiales bacterium]
MAWFDAFSRRQLYGFGALLSAGLVAYAFYLQYVHLMEPCPMCWFQRAVFVLLAVAFGTAALINPGRRGARVAAAVIALLALVGLALALRHLWIQSLPADQLPSCGMGIGYMLETLPFSDVLARTLAGSVECNKIDRVLGLPLPAWNVLLYSLLGALGLIAVRFDGQRTRG